MNKDSFVEKKVAEFAKKITSCTHVDGFHTCVLDDKDDNETYKAVATDWLTTTLCQPHTLRQKRNKPKCD